MTADDALHDVLVRVAANRAAAATIERYTPLIRRLERVKFGPASGRRSVVRHDELVDACAGGDVVTAVEVTARIWRSLEDLAS
jgi:DNA-binding GntR family transcriptional regulator